MNEEDELIGVFDFFSGCGGSSTGFKSAGMDIVMGVDMDSDAASSYKLNIPGATFIQKDISQITTKEIEPIFASYSGPTLFCGCAPCQPFTRQNTQRDKNEIKRNLLLEFSRFVITFLPDYVFVENVPGIRNKPHLDNPFYRFLDILNEHGYKYRHNIVISWNYGVPQRRKRLVLLASRYSEINFPEATHGPNTDNPDYSTARQWIENLPELEAGGIDQYDPVHRAANLSTLNLERIRATPPEGSRSDWPIRLALRCHSGSYNGHTDVYGRMAWNHPANCLTTRCISLSNGRFGHPVQNRAISVREAACLQTFPRDYKFAGNLGSMGRQIGNAVPVLLAQRFGEHILAHWQTHRDGY